MQIIQCRPVKGQIPTHHLSSLILDSSCKSAGADPRCLRRVLHTPQISHWVIVGSTQTGKLSSLTYWPMHNLELSREPIILKFGLWEEARQTQGEHAKSIQKGRGETSLQPSCCKVLVNAPLSVKLSIIAFSVLLHINLNGGSRQDHLILFCMVVNKLMVSICHFDSQKKQAEMLLTLAHFTLYPPIIHFLAHCQHPPKSTAKDGVKKLLRRQPDHELSLSELKVQGSRGTESVMYFNPVARFNNGCSHPKKQTGYWEIFLICSLVLFNIFGYRASTVPFLYILPVGYSQCYICSITAYFFSSCFSITNSSTGSSTC